MSPAARFCCCALVMTLFTTGCSLFGDGSDSSSPGADASSSTTAPNPEILDVGQEPRRPLRLDLVEGTEATIDVALTARVTQGDGAGQIAVAPPTVRQTVTYTVGEVEDDEAAVSFTVTTVDLDQDTASVSDADYLRLVVDLRALVGLTGTGRLSTRGQFASMAYDIPDGLPPDTSGEFRHLGDQLEDLTIPLPEQPLGVGASWRARTTRQVSGFTYQQVSTYQIDAITDTGIGYSVSSSLSAADQAMDPASLPEESSGRLVSADLTGTATGTLDLATGLGALESALTGIQEIEVSADGGPSAITTQTVDVSVTAGPAG